MAEEFDISGLMRKSAGERLADYAATLPDGKAVCLTDVVQELEMNYAPALLAGKNIGVVFNAYLPHAPGGARAFVANPNTIKTWHEAQQKMPPKKRSTSRS